MMSHDERMHAAASPPTRRQATACDWCRAHKVKCDTQQPSCHNCERRGVPCITVNLRKPKAEGQRLQPRGRRSRGSQRSPSTTSSQASADVTFTSCVAGRRKKRRGRVPEDQRVGQGQQSELADREFSPSQYPSKPWLPTQRTFEAQTPDKILPAVFSTPFDSDGAQLVDGQPGEGNNTSVTLTADRSRFQCQASNSGSSQFIMVQWLDLFFARCPTWTPISPSFQQGLAYSVDVPLPLQSTLPGLPENDRTNRLTALFFSRIYPIFPVIDADVFKTSLANLRCKVGHQPSKTLEAQDYPLLASAYAVFSAAADEEAGGVCAEATHYLQAAYSLYARLVAIPYMDSVQALLLITLVLRNRSKDGAGWGSLSQAICIAQSAGLHRHALDHSRAQLSQDGTNQQISCASPAVATDEDLGARLWWAAYTLERTMVLETGRSSLIHDESFDQAVPCRVGTLIAGKFSFDYFHALVRLAQIKARAIRHLYGSKGQGKSVRALLSEMGSIDRALLDWANSFPEKIRPGRDLFCGVSELHLATYVSLDYHQTMIALHRPALMSAPGFLRNRINEYCTGTLWHHRLHFSLCIAAASARAILKAMSDLRLHAEPSRIITANGTLVAILALSIYVTKAPMNHMNNSDIALVSTFTEQLEVEYAEMGQDPEFPKGLKTLRLQLCDYINSLGPHKATTTHVHQDSVLPQVLSHDSHTGDIDYSAEVANLEESWSNFWHEDFSDFLSHHVEQDAMNTYLLGLTQTWA